MWKFSKIKKVSTVVLACSLLFTACGTESNKEAMTSDSNYLEENSSTLVYGSSDYTSINPALYEHGEINSLIFSGLTTHNEKNEVIPDLAEKWEYNENTYTYTFYLKKNVKWQDGKPFTSEDVKFTLETIMNPENGSEIISNYEDITKIETKDVQTVAITMKDPNVAMLDYLTIGILPKHLLEGKDIVMDGFNRKPIGTGPYKLTEWETGQSITLQKNENYYGTSPAIDTVIFKIVPDEKVRAMQLKSGELDFAQISPQDAQQFEGQDGFTIYNMKTADYRGILYNFANPLFQNHRELPNALSYAIDRQSIIDTVLLGKGEIAYSPLQAGMYYNDKTEKYTYDPEKTKKMLEASGWKQNSKGIYEKNKEPLKFAITCPEGDQVRIDIASICAQQLRQIGADVNVSVESEIDWAGQAAYLIGWGSPFDPDDHTYKVFGTEQGANYSAYSNEKVDDLLKKARKTSDTDLRMKYYHEFQKELSKDLPYTFIAYVDAIYVSSKDIKGITENKVLGHHGVGVFWNIIDWSIPNKE